MKHKFSVVFMAFATALCMAFSLSACGEQNPDETGNNPPITDPSGGEQGETQKPDEGEQGETQKPDEGEQGETQKPDEGEESETPVPHVHSFGEWKVTKEATCKETGTKERFCACGEKETETLPLMEHDFEDMTCKFCGIQASLGLKYWLINGDKEYEIWSIGDCTDADLIIPNNYQGKPVTSIGYRSFYDCSELTSINIPNSVTTIGDQAFFDCVELTSITIPNSVTSIGEEAFGDCCGFTSITIGSGVTSIGQYAFMLYGSDGLDWDNIKGLETITVAEENSVYRSEGNCLIERATNTLLLGCKNSVIPQSITAFGEGAFLGCRWMKKLEIPNGVTEIGEGAFADCRGLTSVSIPKSVKKIGKQAFANCDGFKEVHISDLTAWCEIEFGFDANPLSDAEHVFIGNSEITDLQIPSGVTSIKDYSFFECSWLTSVTIPDTVTSIGGGAFEWCKILTTVNIPNSVTSIGWEAFRSCKKLTSIVIPNNVSTIGNYAFQDCSALTSVTIGSGVTSIGEGVFYRCDALKEIHFENPNGWKAFLIYFGEEQPISGLDDPATAAKYLTDTYNYYSWKREG